MHVKDCFPLKIESVAFGGDGVGRKDGLVVFVPFTAAGDVVEVEIRERKKSFARGRLVRILSPSPERTEPLCPYFGVCGGCAYQHIRYEHQLAMKRRQVEDAFIKIGKIPRPPVEDVIGSPRMFAYRGKATLHAVQTAKGRKLGFMDVTGGALADIERCEIMHETINGHIRQIRDGGKILSPEEDITLWSDDAGDQHDVVTRRVKDREFLVPRDGFFQANLYLTDRMVDEVCRLFEPGKVRTVIDACCGCGLFSLFLAPRVRRVIGIEIHDKSVDCARRNAGRQAVENAEFIGGDASDVLGDLAKRGDAADAVVLDPPRAGFDPRTLQGIISIKPADIIYISCNPTTQARDIRVFGEAGYDLCQLQPLDMFPQTQHIETIARLSRRPAA